MKKTFTLLSFLLFVMMTFNVNAQRYLTEVFDDYTVESEVYGVNGTLLFFQLTNEVVPRELGVDIYKPAGDTETDRPLVLYFHTGNFLPHPQNGSASGTMNDSTNVEVCTRLAKMGYVVANVDYRLGWNPTASSQDERVFTLINAAYRGVQDARTAIRYFKMTAAEQSNRHGIDPTKIMLWGQGTGGYISMNTSALTDYNEIVTASDGKFLISDGMGGFVPMVIEGINGDIEGKTVGINPGIPPFPAGDTMCYPNHVDYSSDFQLGVNLGGAVGDSSWIEPGETPLISFHVPSDPFAPFNEGLVLVPVDPPLPVMKVQGSLVVQALSQAYGNNACMDAAADFIDPISENQRALVSNFGGLSGLYPFWRPATEPFDSAPWEWWDTTTNVNNANGLATNPSMSADKARAYIDTAIMFVAPRACLCLDLGCDLAGAGYTTSVPDILDNNLVGLSVGPNPAKSNVTFNTNLEYPIEHIFIYNMQGQLVKAHTDIDNNQFIMPRHSLNSGMYIAKLKFEKGIVSTKILFE